MSGYICSYSLYLITLIAADWNCFLTFLDVMHDFTSYDVTDVEDLCLYLNILQQTYSQLFHIQGETDLDPIDIQRDLLQG